MKKELTATDKNILKKSIHRQSLPDGHILLYCLANKESGTGFFSNERLLLLNSAEKSIQYYSKLPEGLPFTPDGKVTPGKGKVIVDKVSEFKCEAIKGKTSTFIMEWMEEKNKVSWIYGMGSNKMMCEWIAAVNEMMKGVVHQDPSFTAKAQTGRSQTNIEP